MASEKQPTECACGQVVFDLSGRKSGETLVCPWCERTYRFEGGERLEPLTGPKKRGGAAASETSPQPSSKADGLKFESSAEKPKRNSVRIAAEMAAVRVSDHKTGHPHTGAGERVHGTRRKPKEIPGGTLRMAAFIVVFNGLAFVAMDYLLPVDPATRGRRMFWNNELIPQSSAWPVIAALLLGHAVGFLAWSWHVYRLQLKRLLAAHPDAHLKLDPEAEARKNKQ